MGLTHIGRKEIYDGKRLWERYMTWGAAASYKKLSGWAVSEGMLSFGKTKPSQMGPYWSMWRYAVRNPEEAFPLYKDWWFETDPDHKVVEFSDFLQDLKRHARNKNVCSTPAYNKFCQKYNIVTERIG